MQKLIFANGTELSILGCQGDAVYAQGAQRDMLDFRLDPNATTLDQVDTLFTSVNCADLTIQETVNRKVEKIVTEQVEKIITEQVQKKDTQGNPMVDEQGNPVMEEVQKTVTEPVEKVVVEEVPETLEYRHAGYSLRIGLSKEIFRVSHPNGSEKEEVQISVKMGQLTPMEKQMDALSTQMTDTQVALCEVYEIALGGMT